MFGVRTERPAVFVDGGVVGLVGGEAVAPVDAGRDLAESFLGYAGIL